MNGRALRWLMSWMPGTGSLGNGQGGEPGRLIVIRHHRVYGDAERPLYRLGVAERVLEGQLAWLARLGLLPITVSEGLAWLAQGHSGHRVAMTFDDGYADNVTRALPLLVRHRARATFFLTAGWMERREPAWWDVLAHALETAARDRLSWEDPHGPLELPLASPADRARALAAVIPTLRRPLSERGAMLERLRERLGVEAQAPCALATWDQARELVDNRMEVGAHTLDHPWLSQLPAAEQRRQIEGSVTLIAERLGERPSGFAYPGGDYDTVTLSAARASGLSWAVTTRAGDNLPGAPAFELRRRGLSEGACLGPTGRFSDRLALAELGGAFDRLRGVPVGS